MGRLWIKEGKNAVRWTRLSCHDLVDNEVRRHLFVLAYNLGNFLRQSVLRHWMLTIFFLGTADPGQGEGGFPDGEGRGSPGVVPDDSPGD